MYFLELTRPTPAENLALDEALLLSADQAAAPNETLRLWEEPAPVVIVGRGSRVETEVNIVACRQRSYCRLASLQRRLRGCCRSRLSHVQRCPGPAVSSRAPHD